MTVNQNETKRETEEGTVRLAATVPEASDEAYGVLPTLRLPGCVLATRYAEDEELFTALCEMTGEDRAEFGTSCEHTYGIYIANRGGSVFLPDMARSEEAAFAVFAKFADGGVTPDAALEVADALIG